MINERIRELVGIRKGDYDHMKRMDENGLMKSV